MTAEQTQTEIGSALWTTENFNTVALFKLAMQHRHPHRKIRLLACALARQNINKYYPDLYGQEERHPGNVSRIELVEQWADGKVKRSDVIAPFEGEIIRWDHWPLANNDPKEAVYSCLNSTSDPKDREEHANIIREIFDNPHKPTIPVTNCNKCNMGYVPCPVCRLKPTWMACSACNRSLAVQCPACAGSAMMPNTEIVLTPLIESVIHDAYNDREEKGLLRNMHLKILADLLLEEGMPEGKWEDCQNCYRFRNMKRLPGPGYVFSHRGVSNPVRCHVCNSGAKNDKPGSVWVNNPLIAHLSSDGPHYRGCFVLDYLITQVQLKHYLENLYWKTRGK